ncbi:hypothetical protein GCM10022207_63920 [Streptomyces lannensis]|uniref:Transposase n=1 Tax=Streptomyces lannensis TaxID=766498 RepID=A0ABP7KUP9_9ACTN
MERRCLSEQSFTRGAPLSGQCVTTRETAVAEGVFAPGHLGELTQIVPFEMVDEVLAELSSRAPLPSLRRGCVSECILTTLHSALSSTVFPLPWWQPWTTRSWSCVGVPYLRGPTTLRSDGDSQRPVGHAASGMS